MENYNITFKKSVTKDLRAIPKKDIIKILNKIDQLAINPRGQGSIKLSGKPIYRIRQGSYRIVYSIQNEILCVQVIKIGHRSEIYKDF